MDLLRFIFSTIFLRHLLIAAAISVVFISGTFLGLNIYTHHKQSFSVPDFRGLTIEEVDRVAELKDLRYQVVDSVYDNHHPRGTVVEQNPRPNFKVKKNRRVHLTINAHNPEMVEVPNSVGVSLRQARAILETAGLRIGNLSYVPDIAVNNVLQQKYKEQVIEPGDSLEKGSEIDLVLGRGISNEKTQAPKLTGLTLDEAKNKITSRYLNLGAVIYDGSIHDFQDSLDAFIWKQKPPCNKKTRINLGTPVDIWLTADSTKLPVPCTENPGIPDPNE